MINWTSLNFLKNPIMLISLIMFGGICLWVYKFNDTKLQPKMSVNSSDIQQFVSQTAFPYTASAEKTQDIRNGSSKLKLGMSGDEVLSILGPPDILTRLAFPFDDLRGWSWEYFVSRKYARAPDESDRYLMLIFDKAGSLKKIVNELD